MQLSAQSTNFTDENGLKQGAWKKFYPNQKVRYQGTFKDGKPVGEMVRFYENGSVQAKLDYSAAAPRVVAKLYRESGKGLAHGFYLDKKKDSTWFYFSEDGKWVTSIERYRNCVPDGNWEIFYPESEQVSERSSWKNGVMDGPYREFFENGVVKLKSEYVNGKLEGKGLRYYPSGKLKGEGLYRGSLRIGDWVFYTEEGEVDLIDHYNQEGDLVKSEDFGEKEVPYYEETKIYTEEDIMEGL